MRCSGKNESVMLPMHHNYRKQACTNEMCIIRLLRQRVGQEQCAREGGQGAGLVGQMGGKGGEQVGEGGGPGRGGGGAECIRRSGTMPNSLLGFAHLLIIDWYIKSPSHRGNTHDCDWASGSVTLVWIFMDSYGYPKGKLSINIWPKSWIPK